MIVFHFLHPPSFLAQFGFQLLQFFGSRIVCLLKCVMCGLSITIRLK